MAAPPALGDGDRFAVPQALGNRLQARRRERAVRRQFKVPWYRMPQRIPAFTSMSYIGAMKTRVLFISP